MPEMGTMCRLVGFFHSFFKLNSVEILRGGGSHLSPIFSLNNFSNHIDNFYTLLQRTFLEFVDDLRHGEVMVGCISSSHMMVNLWGKQSLVTSYYIPIHIN